MSVVGLKRGKVIVNHKMDEEASPPYLIVNPLGPPPLHILYNSGGGVVPVWDLSGNKLSLYRDFTFKMMGD